MKKINWESVANEYNLSPEEITEQIMQAACIIAIIEIDGSNDVPLPVYKYLCADSCGEIQLAIWRPEEKEQ